DEDQNQESAHRAEDSSAGGGSAQLREQIALCAGEAPGGGEGLERGAGPRQRRGRAARIELGDEAEAAGDGLRRRGIVGARGGGRRGAAERALREGARLRERTTVYRRLGEPALDRDLEVHELVAVAGVCGQGGEVRLRRAISSLGGRGVAG